MFVEYKGQSHAETELNDSQSRLAGIEPDENSVQLHG
jgi:hypothetical protein